jgi:hypothetical protein
MRLLSLDYRPVWDPVTFTSFSGDDSVFDFDVVIWNPASSIYRYATAYNEQYRNLPSLNENTSVSLSSDISRRRKEFLDFVEAGRALVVFVVPPQQCYIDTGERTYSGTGRNRVTTTHVSLVDLWDALPLSSLGLERASGSEVEVVGDGPISALLRKYSKYLSYSAVMKEPPGTVLAKVAGTDRALGSVVKTKGGGLLMLLPWLDFTVDASEVNGADDEEEEGEEWEWPDEAAEFQVDLLDALDQLNESAVQARPAWAERYATKPQQEINEKVVAQRQKVEKARTRLTKLQTQREELVARDQLFLGTGRALELQVRSVFELLGGTVSEPVPGRADWQVAFPEGNAVLEVKGLKKSAAEKHAAQLEKWVAGALEETGEMPKGILIANTWRETALADRSNDDFPGQMLPYSEGRGHCLLTGLRLFLIRADVEADPKRAAHWRKKLLQTNGVLSEPSDWRQVITETGAEPQESETDDS